MTGKEGGNDEGVWISRAAWSLAKPEGKQLLFNSPASYSNPVLLPGETTGERCGRRHAHGTTVVRTCSCFATRWRLRAPSWTTAGRPLGPESWPGYGHPDLACRQAREGCQNCGTWPDRAPSSSELGFKAEGRVGAASVSPEPIQSPAHSGHPCAQITKSM